MKYTTLLSVALLAMAFGNSAGAYSAPSTQLAAETLGGSKTAEECPFKQHLNEIQAQTKSVKRNKVVMANAADQADLGQQGVK